MLDFNDRTRTVISILTSAAAFWQSRLLLRKTNKQKTYQLLGTVLRVLEAGLQDHPVHVGLFSGPSEPPPATEPPPPPEPGPGAEVAPDDPGLECHEFEGDERTESDWVESVGRGEHGREDHGQHEAEGVHCGLW